MNRNYCKSFCLTKHTEKIFFVVFDIQNYKKTTTQEPNKKKEILNTINSLTKELHKRIVLDNGDR